MSNPHYILITFSQFHSANFVLLHLITYIVLHHLKLTTYTLLDLYGDDSLSPVHKYYHKKIIAHSKFNL